MPIFSVVSLYLFLPGSVGTVHSRGRWPSLGMYGPPSSACVHVHVHARPGMECCGGSVLAADTHANFHSGGSLSAASCLCVCGRLTLLLSLLKNEQCFWTSVKAARSE